MKKVSKKKIIKLETVFTPYTLDTYETFTFDNTLDFIREEKGLDVYDDVDCKIDIKGYLKALTDNLVELLNDKILDDVIQGVKLSGEPISPKYYNYDTDKAFLLFDVNIKNLDKYIKENQDHYNKNKIKDAPGFWWFGDDNQTMLEYYLNNVSIKLYDRFEYYQNQSEQIEQLDFVKF